MVGMKTTYTCFSQNVISNFVSESKISSDGFWENFERKGVLRKNSADWDLQSELKYNIFQVEGYSNSFVIEKL